MPRVCGLPGPEVPLTGPWVASAGGPQWGPGRALGTQRVHGGSLEAAAGSPAPARLPCIPLTTQRSLWPRPRLRPHCPAAQDPLSWLTLPDAGLPFTSSAGMPVAMGNSPLYKSALCFLKGPSVSHHPLPCACFTLWPAPSPNTEQQSLGLSCAPPSDHSPGRWPLPALLPRPPTPPTGPQTPSRHYWAAATCLPTAQAWPKPLT